MKKDLYRYDYNKKKKYPFDSTDELSCKVEWFGWTEICDKCGKIIQHNDSISTEKPNTEEVDFCVQCLEELMNSGIKYKEAKNIYGKK